MTRIVGPRLLHLPNEESLSPQHLQIGSRRALEKLAQEGTLGAYRAFSFLHDFRQGGDPRTTWRKLHEAAQEFQPDIIYWQHVSDFPVTVEEIQRLKSITSNPRIVYHEADPYGWFVKRMGASIRTLLPLADLVIMSGTGQFFDIARSLGARTLLVAPQPFDSSRSGKPWHPTMNRKHDLVMIGSFGATKTPGRTLPGARRRRRLARILSKRFGQRFALYGNGWSGIPSSRGPLPFDQQEETIRSAWLSVNWDHFDHVPYYFSNRLSISLAAGVPHVTCYHRGYEHMFAKCDGLYLVNSPNEVVETAEFLLSLPRSQLIELGVRASQFAHENLEAEKVYRRLFQVITERLSPAGPAAAGPTTALDLA